MSIDAQIEMKKEKIDILWHKIAARIEMYQTISDIYNDDYTIKHPIEDLFKMIEIIENEIDILIKIKSPTYLIYLHD